jgi:hypothetical protein
MLVKWEVFLGCDVGEDNSPRINAPSDNPKPHFMHIYLCSLQPWTHFFRTIGMGEGCNTPTEWYCTKVIHWKIVIVS